MIIWLAGKIGQVTKAQSGALGWMGRAVIAGAILGSVGGFGHFWVPGSAAGQT
ncbi:hypothetical protein [Arthrobacter sp. 31Y]|uniref:hypothetical protein n=1 Tax=Arthrobacter sp. 31Y TaxID=1115632 RepID=UPI0004B8C1A8|nr:hypothetical protein [Arthrobacter sp. 31Y]